MKRGRRLENLITKYHPVTFNFKNLYRREILVLFEVYFNHVLCKLSSDCNLQYFALHLFYEFGNFVVQFTYLCIFLRFNVIQKVDTPHKILFLNILHVLFISLYFMGPT